MLYINAKVQLLMPDCSPESLLCYSSHAKHVFIVRQTCLCIVQCTDCREIC